MNLTASQSRSVAAIVPPPHPRSRRVERGSDEADAYRKAAICVDKILKRRQARQTAKALGLTVPQSILTQADEVIE